MNFLRDLTRDIDRRTVVSGVVASFVAGGIIYLAVRSGIKPLKQAARVVKGG